MFSIPRISSTIPTSTSKSSPSTHLPPPCNHYIYHDIIPHQSTTLHSTRHHILCRSTSPDLEALFSNPPDIGADLADIQAEEGAVFSPTGIPITFGQDGLALEAAKTTVAIVDQSHWTRLRLSGPDATSFLQGQSTADIASLQPGSSCNTVITSAQGRTIDVVTCLKMESGLVLIASPNMSSILTTRLSKYVTAFDKVSITDLTPSTRMFSLVGPQSNSIMTKIAATDLIDSPPGSHKVFGFKNTPVVAFSGLNSSAACGGLPGPGYTLICEESTAPDLWRVLTDNDAIPLGEAGWEAGRVVHGRPVPGKELTDGYNPLEAGLYHAVSLNKGCYMGQETLSKVYTQSAVKRQLWGLDLDAPCSSGDAIWPLNYKNSSGTISTRPLGIVSSYVDTPYAEKKALAYLRCKVDGVAVNYYNMDVVVGGKGDEKEKDGGGGVRGRVVPLAYTTTDFLPGTAPNKVLKKSNVVAAEAAATTNEADEAEKRAELARQEKLRKMQERLAAWQQQQQDQQ